MKDRGRYLRFIMAGCAALLAALLVLPVAPSRADVLLQTPTPIRPTLTPTPSDSGSPVSAASFDSSLALAGYVWVNGDIFVPSVGVPVHFSGDGFDLMAVTDGNGYYQFEQIGQDIGMLNVGGEESDWKASVGNVALSVPSGGSLVVNFSASQATPLKGPALLDVSLASRMISSGQTVTVTVESTNSTDTKLSGVWLSHLVPEGLTLSGLTVDRGDTLSVGNLAMANVGDMAPGDVVTFNIIVSAPSDGGPNGNLDIVASMFSRERVTLQASTVLAAMGAPMVLPQTGVNGWLLVVGVALAFLLVATGQLRRVRKNTG